MLGWGPLENGGSLAMIGLVSVVVQGVLLGRRDRRLDDVRHHRCQHLWHDRGRLGAEPDFSRRRQPLEGKLARTGVTDRR